MNHHEENLQASCVLWFRMQYPNYVLYSSLNGAMLNGTPLQRAKTWNRLKKQGALEGVSDLFLMCARSGFNGLQIEMKFGKNKQSQEQIKFQQNCIKENYKYILCYNFDDFQKEIESYLS